MKRWTWASGLLLFAASAASAQLLSTGFDTGVIASGSQGQRPAPWSSTAPDNTSISFDAWDDTGVNGNTPNMGIHDVTVRAVPSPGSAALIGLGGLICLRRRHTT